MADEPYPCARNPRLFDSTLPESHTHAKQICQGCFRLTDCREDLAAAKTSGRPPIGTWAGELLGAESVESRQKRLATKEKSRKKAKGGCRGAAA